MNKKANIKRNYFFLMLLFSTLIVGFSSCEKEAESIVTISTSYYKKGSTQPVADQFFNVGDTLIYRFEVTANAGLSKVEFSEFSGVGINQQSPVMLKKVENMSTTTWIYTDTIEGIKDDVRYSVYAVDNNRAYTTKQINIYLDVTRLLNTEVTLYDGLSNGSSKTFYNIESGRSFFIANTKSDPASIELGFAYLEANTQLKACLVSMDEYWATGNYPMVSNSLYQPVVFKKSTPVSGTATIADRVKTAADLKTAFDNATVYAAVSPFSEGKVAHNLLVNDVVAFKTTDGRYGLIQITNINRRSEAATNLQTVRFKSIVQKKLVNSSL